MCKTTSVSTNWRAYSVNDENVLHDGLHRRAENSWESWRPHERCGLRAGSYDRGFDVAIAATHDGNARDDPMGFLNLQACNNSSAHRRFRHSWQRSIVIFTVFAVMLSGPLSAAARSSKRRAVSKRKKPKKDNRLPFVAAATAKRRGQGGVGMVLSARDGAVIISRVVAGGPAARAGVLAGDQILAIDGWTLPKSASTGDVARKIRGTVGTRCKLLIQRKGMSTATTFAVVRGSMTALFPQTARKVIDVRRGLSLLTTSAGQTIGVQFQTDATPDQLIEYTWAISPGHAGLTTQTAKVGAGAVNWTAQGATIQVGPWRLQLTPRNGSSGMIVRASNLPVALVDADQWRRANPQRLTYVRPRDAPRPYRRTFNGGPCRTRLRVQVNGRPAPNRRLTLWLVQNGKEGLPSASTRTDAKGETTLHLPVANYQVTGLYTSLNGRDQDLYYEAKLKGRPVQIRCPRSGGDLTVRLDLISGTVLSQQSPPSSLPAAASQHPLVGKTLPKLQVRKWYRRSGVLPKTLRNRAMLIYVWATWCGPCKRVSPAVAELHSRLAKQGLVVVSASVDRDANQLSNYVDGQLDGAAPIAWLGPTAMNDLKVSGIPTLIAIDGRGVVRAVHTGTGVKLGTWELFFKKLLKERGRR